MSIALRPRSLDGLRDLLHMVRADGRSIVVTSGSFDLLHLGHVAFLENASREGDFLIVGVDSDDKIRYRKGPNRPYVEENERIRLVQNQRGVDAVFLKSQYRARQFFLTVVNPDVLVVTHDTYDQETLERLRVDLNCKIVIFNRFADGSSTQKALEISKVVGGK